MLEGLFGFGGSTGTASSVDVGGVAHTLWLILLWGGLLGIFVVLLMFIFWVLTHKWQVTVRHLTGGRLIVVRDKARKIKDRKGVQKLRLFKHRENIAMPPDEVVETSNKGKPHLDVYRTQNGEYIWARDVGLRDGVKIPTGRIAEEFEPMNTMDREFYANEWEEAEKYKKTSIREIIRESIPYVFMLIVFALLVYNWGAIMEPANKAMSQSTRVLEQTDTILTKIGQIQAQQQGIQVVFDEEPPPNEAK